MTKPTFKQFLEEGKAGVAVAQSKKTQKKLRDEGHMEAQATTTRRVATGKTRPSSSQRGVSEAARTSKF